MAPIACAPPTLKILVTPTKDAVYKIAAFTLPSLFVGVHNIISLQPAIFAGTPNIRIEENKGADPPGIYKPTFSIATFFLQHVTPFVVTTFLVSSF